jgi:8-oxo-dGTP diphosphatase
MLAMSLASLSLGESVVRAAGGIVERSTDSGLEIAVVHRKRYDDWVLPKGKLQEGESFAQAAQREVQEETGCLVTAGEYAGAVGYTAKSSPKVVLFWRMSVLEQRAFEDREEVDGLAWLPMEAAIRRLTHSAEKDFLARISGHSPPPRSSGHWSWFQNKQRAYARLLREYEIFRVELAFLENRSHREGADWIVAAYNHLNNVENYLREEDIEGGWMSLHTARRHALGGLQPTELATQAAILREESAKVSSWRGKVMRNVLTAPDESLTATLVADAMAMRDEYAANQYHKIWLTGDQLGILLKICGSATPLILPLVVSSSRHPDAKLAPWGYEMVSAVILFGLLGAAFSTAQSLINLTYEGRILERVGYHFVTIARALFGAAAGLAGYAFVGSKVLNISFGSENSTGGALAIAFLFGYTGERLVARVAGSINTAKS